MCYLCTFRCECISTHTAMMKYNKLRVTDPKDSQKNFSKDIKWEGKGEQNSLLKESLI